MLEYLDHLDRSAFFLLNGSHAPWIDRVMWYVSKMWVWFPVYGYLLFLVYRKLQRKQFFLFLLFTAALLFITDFVSVHAIKSTVMRLRPTYNPQVMDRVKMVLDENGNFYRGGRFGFFSNHASNYFGIATFFYLIMKPLRLSAVVLLFGWVTLISYSRIYLGVHYPGDVIAGAAYGMVAACILFFAFRYFSEKLNYIA